MFPLRPGPMAHHSRVRNQLRLTSVGYAFQWWSPGQVTFARRGAHALSSFISPTLLRHYSKSRIIRVPRVVKLGANKNRTNGKNSNLSCQVGAPGLPFGDPERGGVQNMNAFVRCAHWGIFISALFQARRLKRSEIKTPFPASRKRHSCSVGAPGFEPGTPWSQTRYTTGLCYTPNIE